MGGARVPSVRMRALELFSGIGGFAAAVADRVDVVGAVDHDLVSQQIYALNWAHPRFVKNLASVRDPWLAAFNADLWWMSPPCAPHGIRGQQRDVDDPRSAALRRLTRAFEVIGPDHVAMENVPWFFGSRAWDELLLAWERAGYAHVEHGEICPTALGWPSQRRRFYAVASRRPLRRSAASPTPVRLSDCLLPWDEALAASPALLERFGDALHVVDADDPGAIAATFTRAYGNSPVYVGSYLRQGGRIRLFHPKEIAALHGLPAGFDFGAVSLRDGWRRVGNSVSVPVVRHVVGWIPEFGDAR